MLVVPLAQPGQEGRDILGGDLADHRAAPRGQRRLVTQQVAPVRLECVRGQAAFHGQVIQVPVDGPGQRGQLSTSLTGVAGSWWASATGWQVSVPSWVCSPAASAGSARSAARQPWLASSST